MSNAALLVDALARSIARQMDGFDEARQRLLVQVQGELNGLYEIMPVMFDGDLPTQRLSLRRIKLFPLGEYRRIWLGSLNGYSTLHLGEDGRLYEYAPAVISASDLDSPVQENAVRLRPVTLDTLKYHELMSVRDLLRRLQLV